MKRIRSPIEALVKLYSAVAITKPAREFVMSGEELTDVLNAVPWKRHFEVDALEAIMSSVTMRVSEVQRFLCKRLIPKQS